MENWTFDEDIVQLEGLKVSSAATVPAFILLLLIYTFAVVSNVSLVLLIVSSRSLRQPMYLLYCNMTLNDIFGASIVTPHVLRDIFRPHSQRYIHYNSCVLQAFCFHLYAGAAHTVLMIMAFDRYVAICNPLRYSAIMSQRTVVKLSLAAWLVAFAAVVILVGLSVRLTRCRRLILHPFCDNASLFSLSCEDVFINHVYGFGYTLLLLVASLVSVTTTYLKIAVVCTRSRSKSVNSKALQTCATHLAVYVFLLLSCILIVTLHRFPHMSDVRKMLSVWCEVSLPALNAVIYGLQIREIRRRVFTVFHWRKAAQTT